MSTYRIAGHYLHVEGSPEADLLQSIPGFPVFLAEGQEAEWTVCFGCEVTLPEDCRELGSFAFGEGEMHCRFLRKGEDYYFTMQPTDGSQEPFLLHYGGGDTAEATHTGNPSILRFGMWMALGLLSARSKMLLIHSSTIVHQGKAVLFLGESGTGKSTHTRLWMKHIPDAHLLNDDSPVLAIEEGVPVAYGSPWSGKTHCYYPYRFPIAAVVRLSQAPYNRIHRLGVLDAIAALQPSCPPALAQDETYADWMMDILSDAISRIPVFHLECLPDADAAHTSHDAIFGTTPNP